MLTVEDFVSETLRQVIRGVADVQSWAPVHAAAVNPPTRVQDARGNPLGTRPRVSEIDFDIAITAVDDAKTKGGLAVVAGPITLGRAGEKGESFQSVSRIKFSIPVALPPQPPQAAKP